MTRIRQLVAAVTALAVSIGVFPSPLILAASAQSASDSASSAVGARAVTVWMKVTLKATAAAPFNPPQETRSLAIVSAAVFDAVNAVNARYRAYGFPQTPLRTASPEAAALAAGHDAAVALYPEARADLDAAYDALIATLPDGAPRVDGIAAGRAAAAAILKMRTADDIGRRGTYTPGDKAGAWRSTPPRFAPALEPDWGVMRPFLLTSPSQVRPLAPPSLASKLYADDFREIVLVGRDVSTTRTQAQTDAARLWVSTAPQLWNQAVEQLVERRGLDITDSARAFALLNLAGADAFIAAWDAKFAYDQWRPITAIRSADRDDNPATAADPDWLPLLVTPPFPDYPAAHAVFAGAAETVLTELFGESPGAFTMTSTGAPKISRSYENFHDVADEVVNARVWGGVHWRTSCTVGRAMGQEIGRHGLAHFLGRLDGATPRAAR